ncbi:MAG: hypothetical protein JO091_04675 [Acidobacteriaceae bacterium]|nr:hypothetical protein [Acidobacteriaceae bacterium]
MEDVSSMILWPSDFAAPDAGALAGGKACALAALSAAPVRIPEWFVALPDAEAADVQAALGKLGHTGQSFAVRSSAVDEDSAAHSFAGQLQTFLRVPASEVWQRIQDVRASAHGENVVAYRRERGLNSPPQPAAVIVQRIIEPTAAGVAFSADPVSGRRKAVIVAAVSGLGEALVSGDENSDTFLVGDDGTIRDRKLATAEACISDETVLSIAGVARIAEKFFGRPQDIEWAADAQGIWLLQSRPITTLSDTADPDGVRLLWDNSNIAESYGGITLPLTFSFARRAYEEVYRQFCILMGVPRTKLVEQANLFRRMLGIIRGRVYYNLLNWYRVLALLPGFRSNRKFMETMMGVKEPLPDDIVQQIAQGSAWKDALHLTATLWGMLRRYIALDRDIQAFYERLNNALGQWNPDLSRHSLDELTDYYRSLETQLLAHWDAPLVNDFFAMIAYGVLRKLCASWCDDKAGTLQNDLLSAQGGVISTEPAARVRQLAEICASDPALKRRLATGTWRDCQAAIAANAVFAREFDEYLERFGDRCMDELKLESATLRDDPMLLLRAVANLAGHHYESQTATLRQQAEERVRLALKRSPVRSAVFRWVLEQARRRVAARENLRFERTRVFGRVRLIFLELGRRFYAIDRLTEPRDVFYLEVEEVLGFVEGTLHSVDLAGLVQIRRKQYESYALGCAPPSRFATRGAVNLGNLQPQAETTLSSGATTWQGIGACPGVVRGRVSIVSDPRNAQLQPGEILVAERTDPGWVLLFPLAAGLLVERGSLLSHSAIIARELGLPAIVNLTGITSALRSGEEIEMDGATGAVRRLDA